MDYRQIWHSRRNARLKKQANKPKEVLESRVVRITTEAATAAGFIHRKVTYANRIGAPDDWYFGFDGRLIIIEFKATNKEPMEHQVDEIAMLRLRGFTVYVIDNEEDGVAIFKTEGQW